MESIIINSPSNFEAMRKAGKLAASVLDYITDFIKPDVTTNYLNDLCHEFIVNHGAIPAPLNYRGFPKSICTSINHVICHGIPDDRKIKNGDVMNIDVTVILDGWHGDTSRMYWVGDDIPIKAQRLSKAAYEAMMLGIAEVKPGAHIGNIGAAIQKHVESYGYSSVRDYCGHGIGKIFHTAPNVLHYGKRDTGIILQEGMFFTVEPMVNAGSHETKLNSQDGWTVTTKDRSLSCQFEHTIAVTKDGFEIFTESPKKLHCPPYYT